MSTSLTRAVIVLGALVVLVAVNFSIYGKEQVIRSGESIYLEIAPIDPRSLMQGDYMALRFRLADAIAASASRFAATTLTPRASIVLDEHRIARLAANGAAGDLRIRYRIRSGQVWLGTNAYFFEEGSASRYTSARYGEFRVDRSSGDAVLIGLRDAELRKL